jgi:hypothetical protein
MTTENAAVACGVSGRLGSRWFRERGGMPSTRLGPSQRMYLSFAEREENDLGVRESLAACDVRRRRSRAS